MTYRAVSILAIAFAFTVPSISPAFAQQSASEDQMLQKFMGQTRGLKLRNRPPARDGVETGAPERVSVTPVQPFVQPATPSMAPAAVPSAPAATSIVVFEPAPEAAPSLATVYAPADGLDAAVETVPAATPVMAYQPEPLPSTDAPAIFVPSEIEAAPSAPTTAIATIVPESLPESFPATVETVVIDTPSMADATPVAFEPAMMVPVESVPQQMIAAPPATIVPEAVPESFPATVETVAIEAPSTSDPAFVVFEPTIMAPVENAPQRTVVAPPVEVAPVPAPNDNEYVRQSDENIVQVRVFFEHNSTSLSRDTVADLEKVCRVMKRLPAESRFQVIGHTDKSGSKEYNLYLSRNRAREVVRHLGEECDFPTDRLIAIGVGEQYSDPDTPARSSDERRVEFQFLG